MLASVDRTSACPDPVEAQLQEYNTATLVVLLSGKRHGEAITVPMAGGALQILFSTLLDVGNPKFVVKTVKSVMTVGLNTGSSASKLQKLLELRGPLLTLPSSLASYSGKGHGRSMA